MKNIRQVIQKSLIQSSLLVLILVVIFTNLGFTWMFRNYVAQIRENEVNLVRSNVVEAFEDNVLTADERTLMRQTANQSGVHLLVLEGPQEIFDSTIGGNGAKRPLLSKEKQVIDLDSLVYTQYALINDSVSNRRFSIGQQKGWLLNQEDIGFVVGVNLTFLMVTLVALPLVWGLSRWLSVKLSKPVLQIHEATELIQQGAYHDVALERCETLELNDLMASIEILAFELDHQEKLRKRLTTDMAHELRSPLAVLRSQLEGLMDGVIDPSVERFGRLNGEVMRLTKMIDDLNELTTVENELYELRYSSFNLSELLQGIVSDFKLMYEGKGILLNQDIIQNVHVSLDEARVKQIVSNLLSNAYKYTDQGWVTIKLVEVKGGVVIEVTDSGIGISETDLPFIFQRFYRADPSRSRETGGSGIGLTIVEALVKAQSGKIEIESELGKGTSISVFFPKS